MGFVCLLLLDCFVWVLLVDLVLVLCWSWNFGITFDEGWYNILIVLSGCLLWLDCLCGGDMRWYLDFVDFGCNWLFEACLYRYCGF